MNINRLSLFLINIYAPSVGTDRIQVFDNLNKLISDILYEKVIILSGDFNCNSNHRVELNNGKLHPCSAEVLITAEQHRGPAEVDLEALKSTPA